MKTRKLDADLDQNILVGLIVSTEYLRQVQDMYKPYFLMTPFAVTVAGWCFEYFKEYGKAPMQHIQDIFHAKERAGLDDKSANLIEQFLSTISSKYEQSEKFNVDYLLHETELLFRKRGLECRLEDANAYLAQGELEEAEKQITEYKIPEMMKVCGAPFSDENAFRKAFEARAQPLFSVPGALGLLLNPHFVPEGLFAFLGREKIGKTWLLMELKKWALYDRCNVAMFQLGDLSEDDYRVRQGVQYAGKSNDSRYCGELFVPVLDCMNNQQAKCPYGGQNHDAVRDEHGQLFENILETAIKYHLPCTRCYKRNIYKFKGATWWEKRPPVDPLNWKEAFDATKLWEQRHKIGRFKLAVHPNDSLNVAGVDRKLNLWQQQDGFVPRVIILDYPDIMTPEDSRITDPRAIENARWKALRRLAQVWHALVIVVTQRNWEDHNAETAAGQHVSEDKRKLAHTTAFFSLNQTDEEKEQGILRVAPMSAGIREGHSNPFQQVVVLQCLQIGKPVVASYFTHKKPKSITKKK